MLSVPVGWVRAHSRSGLIPHVRLGRYVRYRRETVLAWLAEQEQGGAAWRKHRPRSTARMPLSGCASLAPRSPGKAVESVPPSGARRCKRRRPRGLPPREVGTMPSGAAVIRYAGKRGVVWYVKYRDASGKQVKERLGPAREGWTKRKAGAALRSRLTDVEREGYRQPERTSFEAFAREWIKSYPDAKGLKRSTRRGYEQIVENHLIPTFGTLAPQAVTVDRIERFLADRRKQSLSAATLNRILNVLL